MKSLQLSALKSAERFVLAEIEQREAGGPSEYLSDAVQTKQIIQRAIVDAEIQPDLRVEMLATLKRALQALNTAKSFNTGVTSKQYPRGMHSYTLCSEIEDVIRRAER